jgi:hypothetical protein
MHHHHHHHHHHHLLVSLTKVACQTEPWYVGLLKFYTLNRKLLQLAEISFLRAAIAKVLGATEFGRIWSDIRAEPHSAGSGCKQAAWQVWY